MCRYLPRSTPSMSLTATLTLLLPLLRTAVSAGCSGVGVVIASIVAPLRPQASPSAQVRHAAGDAELASCSPATAATAAFISSGPIAPMQPTRKVSTLR